MPRGLPEAICTLIIAASARRRTALRNSLERAAPITAIAVMPGLAGASAYLQDVQPDVVLVDLEPSVKPAEIESFLQESARGSYRIAVVLLVEYPEPALTARMLSLGASAILQRDSSREQICFAIRCTAEELVVLSPETIDDLLSERGTDGADLDPLVEELTPRELEVLRMAAAGLANRVIAERLGVSEHTIKFHISSILGKLGAGSRTEAVAQGIKRGLVLL